MRRPPCVRHVDAWMCVRVLAGAPVRVRAPVRVGAPVRVSVRVVVSCALECTRVRLSVIV